MHEAVSPAKPLALVVDDDAAIRTVLRHGLEDAGIEVIEAADGASALRLIVDRLLELDLLVTDLRMPGLDGPTLVRIVRAEGGERELAIVVLSSSIGPRDRELLDRLGVEAMVDKAADSSFVIARAVALATAGRDRRLGIPPPAPTPVPIASVTLSRVLVRS